MPPIEFGCPTNVADPRLIVLPELQPGSMLCRPPLPDGANLHDTTMRIRRVSDSVNVILLVEANAAVPVVDNVTAAPALVSLMRPRANALIEFTSASSCAFVTTEPLVNGEVSGSVIGAPVVEKPRWLAASGAA